MRKGFKHIVKLFATGIIYILCSQQLTAQHQGTDYPAGTQTQVNFIRTWDAMAPEQDPNALMTRPLKNVKQATQYLDGLGRPIQTVIKEGSLETITQAKKDIVSVAEYDAFGREQYKYLPFVAGSNDGAFKLNPFTQQVNFMTTQYGAQGETFFYSKTNFEASPLNRPSDTYAPGNSWVGSEANPDPAQRRNVQMKYYSNTGIDAVRIWNVSNDASIENFGTYTSTLTYPAGELYKNITIDEHKKQVIEFKDKEGKVILKKVQISTAAGTEDDGTGRGHPGWFCTYYIYDDLNNLRCVIQPEAVNKMSDPNSTNWSLAPYLAEQCFRYEYDHRNRMIMKKVPGAGEVYMVYDNRDRMVATSTAAGRAGTYTGYCSWIFTLYDALNRPVATGDMGSCLGLTGMINYVNTLNNGNVTFQTQPGVAISLTAWNPIVGNDICIYCSSWYINTVTHYDDYAGMPLGLSDYVTTWNNANYFAATDNANWPYPQMPQKSTATKGMVTWTKTRVLGTGDYLNTVNYYDDKARVIQVQSNNITGGTDVTTTQYSWAGQPLVMVQKLEKASTPAQTTLVITQLTYDHLNRAIKTEKKVSNTLVPVNNVMGAMPTAFTTTSELQYDNLGQLKKKSLGNKPGTNTNPVTPLAKLDYEYNIRGWLLSVNKDYVTNASNADQYFGMQLGYDKNGTLSTFVPQHNGNISGTIWKSEGDQQKRKYDFSYDAVNRLTGANFNQYVLNSGTGTTAVFDKTAQVDFSVNNLSFDANGNIKTMNQVGLKLNTFSTIDQLAYSYQANSNKLLKVSDGIITTDNGKLGDFKDGANGATDDYNYDANGNLTIDHNKNISAITYNYLNLPTVISVTGKGSITYTYDAAGNKIKKQSVENPTTANGNKTITTTTTYIAGNVYETKTTVPVDAAMPDYTDRLQFIAHEEGRIRFKPATTLPASFQYDYMLKDHLGNVRMVLTEEVQTNIYPAATLEGIYSAPGTAQANSMINTEKQFYNIDNTKVIAETSIPSWPTETTANTKLYYNHNGNPPANTNYPAACTPVQTAGSTKLYKLNATANKTGLEFMIKVMAGDKIDILGKSYFLNTGPVNNNNSTPLNLAGLMLNMLSSPANAAAGKGISSQTLTTINTNQIPSDFFRGSNGESTTMPKAYINYIFLDEQFKYAGGNASRVGSSGLVKDHWYVDAQLQNISVPKNGYIFVYISNESNLDVFFDNLQVIHKPGPILEETHYYPFGLTMSGISSKVAGGIENKAQKFQNQEFNDDLGVNYYEFKWRHHDPQIGRFIQIDPLAEDYVYNSTYAFSENKVTAHVELEGLEAADFRIAKDIEDVQSGKISSQQLSDRLNTRGKTDAAAIGGGLVIGGGVALSFMYPAAASLVFAAEISGVPSPGAPTSMASTVISESKSISRTTVVTEESATTVYRGVNESQATKYADALKGKASPNGGTATPTEHNAGNTNSIFTSWSTNPEVAKNYALRPDGKGVVLTTTVPNTSIVTSPSVKSVNLKQSPGVIVNESEVLLKGKIQGSKAQAVQ